MGSKYEYIHKHSDYSVFMVAKLKAVRTFKGAVGVMKIINISTHANVCANDQVIRATPPHTAPVRGPCHSHGTATAMGLRGRFRLRRRGRWWWWWWNWNTHTVSIEEKENKTEGLRDWS